MRAECEGSDGPDADSGKTPPQQTYLPGPWWGEARYTRLAFPWHHHDASAKPIQRSSCTVCTQNGRATSPLLFPLDDDPSEVSVSEEVAGPALEAPPLPLPRSSLGRGSGVSRYQPKQAAVESRPSVLEHSRRSAGGGVRATSRAASVCAVQRRAGWSSGDDASRQNWGEWQTWARGPQGHGCVRVSACRTLWRTRGSVGGFCPRGSAGGACLSGGIGRDTRAVDELKHAFGLP
eukprot:scaffold240451_cov27-Tisochrysis_lutea.AAC.4